VSEETSWITNNKKLSCSIPYPTHQWSASNTHHVHEVHFIWKWCIRRPTLTCSATILMNLTFTSLMPSMGAPEAVYIISLFLISPATQGRWNYHDIIYEKPLGWSILEVGGCLLMVY
jgi:hypothetical protein